MDTLSEEHFRNDDGARAFLEGLRWPDGPICPHCGVVNHAYPTKRAGVYRCAEKECRKDFTVTMNTPMERSHIACTSGCKLSISFARPRRAFPPTSCTARSISLIGRDGLWLTAFASACAVGA